MFDVNFNVRDLKLGQVRYFDKDHNGIEVIPVSAYVILFKNGNDYYNIFNVDNVYPVYKRVPYSNTTMDGEDFGTKIVLDSGECKDGLCYVLENKSLMLLFKKDVVSYEELLEYVINSKFFFVDRLDMLKNYPSFLPKDKRNHKIAADSYRLDLLNNCLNHEIEKTYCK